MKYQQPFGITEPDASYINGDPSIGRKGSIPPAAAFEYPMREIVSLIGNSGISPSDDELDQVAKAVRSQRMNYLEDHGTVNNILVTPDFQLDAYTVGLPLRVKMANTNTLATFITVGSLGAVEVVRANGSSVEPNELKAGQVVCLVFDGLKFQIQNFLGLDAGATYNNYYNVDLPYVHDTGPAANQLVGLYNPVIATLTDGLLIGIRLSHTVTGACTIKVNNNPTVPVVHGDGTAVAAGDGANEQIWLLVYDGPNNRFQLASASKAGPQGPAGPQGFPGPQGAQGPQGPAAAFPSPGGIGSYLLSLDAGAGYLNLESQVGQTGAIVTNFWPQRGFIVQQYTDYQIGSPLYFPGTYMAFGHFGQGTLICRVA